MTDLVRRLTALAGLPARRGSGPDWPAAEKDLGRRLPGDYRDLVETLPDGAFRGLLKLNRPTGGDFLGFSAYRLEDMRGWRDTGRGHYPHPIFPEPGGLLPWATGPRLEQVFWLTGDEDPDRWPVVLADAEFQRWGVHPGPAAGFLLDALEGRFDTAPYGFDLADGGRPAFVPDEPEQAPPGESVYRTASEFFPAAGSAVDEFDALAAVLGPPPAGDRVPVPAGPPGDYRRFLAAYGPGRVGQIEVPPPGDLVEEVYLRLRATPFPCAVHPEPGGIVAWGRTVDGGILAWAPTVPDPQRWGTVIITGDLVTVWHAAELSCTGLLRRYADPAEAPPAGLSRPPGPVRFRPAPVR